MKKIVKVFSYYRGDGEEKLASMVSSLYGDKRVFLFSNARTAEYIFLKSLGLPVGSNILMQAFTCNAVVNPVLWLKLNPVYIDILPKTYGMDIQSLKERIDGESKVAILQHTFGIDGEYSEHIEFLKSKCIYVLEDCAHALGNGELGVKGDAAIVSFGIEKILSTRVGGALIVNNPELLPAIEREYRKLKYMGWLSTFTWLINPVIWRLLRKLGPLQRGVSLFLNRIGVVNMGFYRSELKGLRPSAYPRKLSPVLCDVVIDQLRFVDDNLKHRCYINDIYASALDVPHLRGVSSVRFPLVIKDLGVLNMTKKALDSNGVYYGDWYNPLVYPASTSIEAMGYKWGSCPVAEEVSRHILNLPTGFSVSKTRALEISKVVRGVLA